MSEVANSYYRTHTNSRYTSINNKYAFTFIHIIIINNY